MVGGAQQAMRIFSCVLSGYTLPAQADNYYPGINTMYTWYPSYALQWQFYQIINY